jgi:hypothetical protein
MLASREQAMHDRPTFDELLRAVELLLEEDLVPALEGARQYNARVAVNVLRAVRRELAFEEGQLDQEWRGLDIVLGSMDRPSSREAMLAALRKRNEQLAERIRAGEADEDAGDFHAIAVAHLRDVVRGKLEVSNPAWLEQ